MLLLQVVDMRVVVGLLPKLYLYPQLLLVLEVQLVLLLLVIAFVLVINNSVLIQWGLFNQTTSLGEYVSEGNFPISFTNASYSALCIPACYARDAYEKSWYWMFEYSTVSWCAFRTWSKDNTPSMKWIAIGY